MESFETRNHTGGPRRAWVEVDLQAVRHNTALVQGLLPPGCALMAVAKADAYGHGAARLAQEWEQSVDTLCVATLDEAVDLREHGVGADILVLGYSNPADAAWLQEYDLIQTVADHEHGLALAGQGFPLRAHLKVDTGMNRLGVPCGDIEAIAGLLRTPGLAVEGVFTHFAASDETAPEAVRATKRQVARFAKTLADLRARGLGGLKTHMQSSYGILNYPGLRCSWARAGLALFGGIEESRLLGGKAPDLRPALTVRAKVERVCNVAKGEGVGYGPAYVANSDRRVASVSIGYGDGIPRALSSGQGSALVGGVEVPVIGLVCMDRLHLDVTHASGVRQGDTVTLLGRDGEREITVAEMAKAAGTIPNEIFSRLGPRLGRFYTGAGEAGPAKAPARAAFI